jgi:hypothetical protein
VVAVVLDPLSGQGRGAERVSAHLHPDFFHLGREVGAGRSRDSQPPPPAADGVDLQSGLRYDLDMTSAKKLVIEVLQSLPDDCSLEDVQYELYVRQKIVEGERAADEGKLVPHEEVMREARAWLRRL